METKTRPSLNLQLFADGAASATGSAAAEGEGTAAVETVAPSLAKRNRVSNPLANVQYGKTETDPTTPDAQTEPEITTNDNQTTDKVDFKTLIKGDYKEDFDKSVQAILDKRLKNTKKAQETLEALQPGLEALASRYGVDPTDMQALTAAINNDNSLYEEAALEKGLTVEQYRNFARIEQENRQLNAMRAEQERQQQMNQFIEGLRAEAEELKANRYPNIDFDAELSNPGMYDLLSKGVGFKAAYEATHFDELNQGTLQYAAKKIAKDVTNNVTARQSRPIENGLSSQAATTIKADVSKFTKADRAEIARRVAHGEVIRL